MKSVEAVQVEGSGEDVWDLPVEGDDVRSRRPGAWWYLAPVGVGALVLGGLGAIAFLIMTAADARALVLASGVAHLALTAGALLFVGGAALVVVGIALFRVLREVGFVSLTQEGLIEEVSQEFDKVRAAIDRVSEHVTRTEARVARAATAAERVERDLRWLDERLGVLESRPATPSPLITPPTATEPQAVTVNVIARPDVRQRGR